jgi:predicted  nucleic acid-binding Zn-ribbon protein
MIQLQVQTLKEANQVLAYFYQVRRVPTVNAALDAIAEEVKQQQKRLGDLTAQRKALRARGVSPLDEQMQELNREIEQLNTLIQKITERYQQERAILNP